ncbi:uncharacterized protein LOC141903437 [Tubulanus polymorphus]|uniref:uncharacterized protein LOC141903437 n=1 Tax=Tubulanus polymorphus TaxID=672921 RepID=UPI003DA2C0B8
MNSNSESSSCTLHEGAASSLERPSTASKKQFYTLGLHITVKALPTYAVSSGARVCDPGSELASAVTPSEFDLLKAASANTKAYVAIYREVKTDPMRWHNGQGPVVNGSFWKNNPVNKLCAVINNGQLEEHDCAHSHPNMCQLI